METKLTSKEQAENAVRWAKALASGRYKKTHGTLRKEVDGETRYCCLGVACRVFKTNTSEDEYEAVKVLLGLNTEIGDFFSKGKPVGVKDAACLTELNDETFRKDDTFRNVHSAIVSKYRRVFRPSVAKFLRVDGNALRIVAAAKPVAKRRNPRKAGRSKTGTPK